MALADVIINNQIQAFKRGSSGVYVPAHAQPDTNDFLVAQGLPAFTEMTRLGEGWATMATAAVAALVVRPTTVAALEIFNNESVGGQSLIVDRIFSHWLVSTAVPGSATLYAMVTRPKAAPADAALAINSLSGKAADTRTVLTAASTTVVDNGWFPWDSAFPPAQAAATVTPQGGIMSKVEGRLIVPPTCSLCLHVVANVVGNTFTSGASWYKQQLTLK